MSTGYWIFHSVRIFWLSSLPWPCLPGAPELIAMNVTPLPLNSLWRFANVGFLLWCLTTNGHSGLNHSITTALVPSALSTSARR